MVCSIKKIIPLVFLVFLVFAATSTQARHGTPKKDDNVAANPTRPSVSDNAYKTYTGYLELEVGMLFEKNIIATPHLFKFGLSDRVELGFSSSGIAFFDTSADVEKVFQDPGLQVKTQWVRTDNISFASVGRAEWINHSDLQMSLVAVGSGNISVVGWDVTLGGSLSPQGSNVYETNVTYAIALYPNWEKKFDFYVEFFGEYANSAKPIGIDAGISYNITPRFVVDLAAFKGLNSDASDWQIQSGITWTFAQLY